MIHFFTQAGTVLRRTSSNRPERIEVEALLDEFGGEAQPVIDFLQALENLCDLAGKNGHPQREDCARYLRACECNEEAAIKFMQTIHKVSNPKPPKPPPKGSKKPPQPHLAAGCGFPSRSEAEWGLRSTRMEDKEGKPLNIDKALELLGRLHAFDEERQATPEKYGQVGREDIAWALDPKRTERLVQLRPLSHEEYTSGASPASILLQQIGALITVSQVQRRALLAHDSHPTRPRFTPKRASPRRIRLTQRPTPPPRYLASPPHPPPHHASPASPRLSASPPKRLARSACQGIVGGSSSSVSKETRREIWDAIEKFQFNKELAQKYITGVRTLMLKQNELSIESREEVRWSMCWRALMCLMACLDVLAFPDGVPK